MHSAELQTLMQLLAKLPGFGPRSGRRVGLYLLDRREDLMYPLAEALLTAAQKIKTCEDCGNLDTQDPCAICQNQNRDSSLLCVVEDVADLWALERSSSFKGRYHVLGGTLSALDGISPEDLKIPNLRERVQTQGVQEVILALNATVDGQTTAHYLAECLAGLGVIVSALAHGVPVGGELDYLDEGTLSTALKARHPL